VPRRWLVRRLIRPVVRKAKATKMARENFELE
jgi:hypothetical protein